MKTPEASPGQSLEVTQSSSGEGPTAHATVSPPSSPRHAREMEPAPAPLPSARMVQYYRGKEGKPLAISSNYLKLDIEKGKGVYEYEVSYEPRIDNRNTRFRLLNQHRNVYGAEKVSEIYFFFRHSMPLT